MYLPGTGIVDTEVYRLDASIKQYNERLSFGVNEYDGSYCIFMRMPSPEPPIAILGFQDKIPTIDEARKRLWETDTQVHGMKIYDDIVKSQEDFKKHKKYIADQASGDSAERVELLLRKHGKSPIIKSLRKKGVKTNDAG